MHNNKYLKIIFFLFYYSVAHSSEDQFHRLEARMQSAVKAGEILVFSKVTSEKSETVQKQNLKLSSYALHPKGCPQAFLKLQQYESYKNYITFIKESIYDENSNNLYFLLDHSLLPFKMSLSVKINRMTGVGVYPFVFEKGIFPGLIGNIFVSEFDNKCLVNIDAMWDGKHTGFNNVLIELIAETLTKTAIEKLVHISRY